MAEIREAGTQDLGRIADLWLLLGRMHEDLDPRAFQLVSEARERWMRHASDALGNTDQRILVAVENNRVVGFIFGGVTARPPLFSERRLGEIIDIFVEQRVRRRGIGSRLVDGLMDWFREKGVSRVGVQHYTGNELAREFWRNSGFQRHMDRRIHVLPR